MINGTEGKNSLCLYYKWYVLELSVICVNVKLCFSTVFTI